MTEKPDQFAGTGPTPYRATRELVPDQDSGRVGWIGGLERIPDCPDLRSIDERTQYELTVIYTERPEKQWLVEVSKADGRWQAFLIGRKDTY